MDASLKWCSTPPLWHTKAVGGVHLIKAIEFNEEFGFDEGGNDTVYISVAGYDLSKLEYIETIIVDGTIVPPVTKPDQPPILPPDSPVVTPNLVLKGGAGHDWLEGKGGNDRINGGLGDDVLLGGAGGSGKDVFVFNTAPNKRTNVDTITDFRSVDDTFRFESAVLKKIGGVGRLKADAFRVGKAAQDGEDRIIYDKGTGSLYYDADGTGAIAAIKIAVLSNKATVKLADLAVI
jgi:Ca2+-binding RTX toxin-like protein